MVESGRFGQCRVRAHAEREDHDVGRIRLARLLVCTSSAPPSSCANPATPSSSARWTPCRLQVALDEARELPVERSQHLIEHLDERHLEPRVDQVLRRLETDEAAADHHRAPRAA